MPREPITTKAARLLRDQRLHVKRVDRDTVEAVVHGDHDNYRLGHRNGSWYCDCPARVECAHVIALQRVTTPCPAVRPILQAP
jgi:hypothetical protein